MVFFQLVIDCAAPDRLARFWADGLGYELEEPPGHFDTWREYWQSIGVPEEELGDGDCADSIVDPEGAGPRIWFQQVPEGKVVKNRFHLDIKVGGKREEVPLATRRARVDAKVEQLVRAGASVVRVLAEPGVDHYAVAMTDPEGNEFDVV
ncbi:VOC family protein [Nonomuraea guangzhouensis]|uniref:VOC family protein n=1 Tax=Nonomuraea guangzhouensis TaxID=1291555 RepID=A0ABW4GNG0_9ACTN|nr:VOC family protein [Nonomuraea guangzhouensis]